MGDQVSTWRIRHGCRIGRRSGYHPSHDAVTSRRGRSATERPTPGDGTGHSARVSRSRRAWPSRSRRRGRPAGGPGPARPAPRPPGPADAVRPTSTSTATAPSAAAVSATLSTRHRHRTGPGVPGLQGVETGEAEQRLAAVGPLQHDHGHLGLLVRGQSADGGADPGRRRHDRHQQPVTAQGRDGPQVVVGLVASRRSGQGLPDAGLGAPSSPGNGDGASARSCGRVRSPARSVGRVAGSGVAAAARRHRSRAPAIPQPSGERVGVVVVPIVGLARPVADWTDASLGRRAPPPLHRSRPDRGDRRRCRVAQGQPRAGRPGRRSGAGTGRALLHRAAPAGLGRGGGRSWAGRPAIIFTPSMWFGISLLGLCVVLWVVGGLLTRRRPEPRAARLRPAAAASDAAVGAGGPPRRTPRRHEGRPRARHPPEVDPEMAEIEAILKNRGIN